MGFGQKKMELVMGLEVVARLALLNYIVYLFIYINCSLFEVALISMAY